MPFLIGITIITSTLLTAPHYGLPEGTLEIEPAAEPIRAAVLDWTKSLKSFSGSYEVRTYNSAAARNSETNGCTIEYRFEGDDYYVGISQEINVRNDKYPVQVFTYIDGVLSSTLYHKNVPSETYVSPSPRETRDLPNPWTLNNIIPPPVFFGHDLYYLFLSNLLREISLEEFLSSGYSCVVSTGEQHVMKHFGKDYSIEFTVDHVGLVQRMRGYVDETLPCTEDTRQRLLDEYDYDVNLLERPVFETRYADYFFAGGMWFPSTVSTDHYRRSKEAETLDKDLGALRDQSNWTRDDPVFIDALAELRVKIATMKLYSISTTAISFKKEGLQINVPFAKSDFVAEVPPGAMIFDKDGSLLYRNTYWFLTPQAKRVLVPAILVVLFLCICGFIFVLYRRRNHRLG